MICDAADGINSEVIPSKAIRRIRVRDAEFDKTTSKKIVRKQSSQGRRIR